MKPIAPAGSFQFSGLSLARSLSIASFDLETEMKTQYTIGIGLVSLLLLGLFPPRSADFIDVGRLICHGFVFAGLTGLAILFGPWISIQSINPFGRHPFGNDPPKD